MAAEILVTGGAGSLGRNIVSNLLARGYKVAALDNLTGSTAHIPDDIRAHERFRFINGDIRNNQTCVNAVSQGSIIIHLAGVSTNDRSGRNRAYAYSVNIRGFENILKAGVRGGSQRLVFISRHPDTDAQARIYIGGGLPDNGCTVSSQTQHLIPHLIGERYIRVYRHKTALELVGLRFFSIGKNSEQGHRPYSGTLVEFMRKLSAGAPLCHYGDSAQTYLPETDAADSIIVHAEPNRLKALNLLSAEGTSFNIHHTFKPTTSKPYTTYKGLSRTEIEDMPYRTLGGTLYNHTASRLESPLGIAFSLNVSLENTSDGLL